MSNPEQPNEFQQLERDPKFSEALVRALTEILLAKKFGQNFYDEYLRKAIAAVSKSEKFNPNPEILKLTEEIESCKSLDQVRIVARANGVEITDDDVRKAKISAIEILEDENN